MKKVFLYGFLSGIVMVFIAFALFIFLFAYAISDITAILPEVSGLYTSHEICSEPPNHLRIWQPW